MAQRENVSQPLLHAMSHEGSVASKHLHCCDIWHSAPCWRRKGDASMCWRHRWKQDGFTFFITSQLQESDMLVRCWLVEWQRGNAFISTDVLFKLLHGEPYERLRICWLRHSHPFSSFFMQIWNSDRQMIQTLWLKLFFLSLTEISRRVKTVCMCSIPLRQPAFSLLSLPPH